MKNKTYTQGQLFKADTSWFHMFRDMIESGDVSKMGPYALATYIIVKAYSNWSTGRAFPSIDLIAKKTGISRRKTLTSLKELSKIGYIKIEKKGRKNTYILREKVRLVSESGETALASWDYISSSVKAAQSQLRSLHISEDGQPHKTLKINNLTLNVNIVQGDQYNIDYNAITDPAVRESVIRCRTALKKNNSA